MPGVQVRPAGAAVDRNQKEDTSTYPELTEALAARQASDFSIDGEIVAFDGSQTSFARLQQRLGVRRPGPDLLAGVPVCENGQEFVAGGFTDPRGIRTGFGALLLGYYDPGHQLIYAGKVGTGFTRPTLHSLHAVLVGLERDWLPFDRGPCREPVCAGCSPAWSPRWASANGLPTGSCATRGSRACGTIRTPPMLSGRCHRTPPGKHATVPFALDDVLGGIGPGRGRRRTASAGRPNP